MKKDNRKKNPFAAIIVAIVLILSFITKNDDAAEAVVGLLGFAVVIVPIVLIIRAAKKKTGKTSTKPASSKPASSYHSHDRLSQNNLAAERSDGLEHYKRQLDDFLSAGIIDRAEYRQLLNKYKNNLQ